MRRGRLHPYQQGVQSRLRRLFSRTIENMSHAYSCAGYELEGWEKTGEDPLVFRGNRVRRSRQRLLRTRCLAEGIVAGRPSAILYRHTGSLLDLFANAGSLAAQITQVIQLCPADRTAADHVDLYDRWRIERENSFYALAKADLPHRKRARGADVALPDHYALKGLDAFLFAFLDLHMHSYGVSRSECGNLRPALHVNCFFKCVHDVLPSDFY